MRRLRRRVCLLAGRRVPALRAAPLFAALPLQVSLRSYLASTSVLRDGKGGSERAAAASAPEAEDGKGKAEEPVKYADLGKRLFSLHDYHRASLLVANGDYVVSQRIAREAWDLLQSVPDEDVERLSTRNVAEMVCAFNYFSAFWENGMEGPARSSFGSARRTSGVSDGAKENGEHFSYPIVERHDAGDRGAGDATDVPTPPVKPVDHTAPPKRANPLDEILDF